MYIIECEGLDAMDWICMIGFQVLDAVYWICRIGCSGCEGLDVKG